MSWQPGDHVQWTPHQPASYDYGSPITGHVADAPHWPEIDPTPWASGARIPVDLDHPITIPERKSTRPITMTRLWVREQYLEPYQERQP